MKFTIIFALILFVAFTYASPADKKETAPACSKACTADYTPICGKPKDGKGSDITFGNSCVMESYNCEKSDRPYIKSSDGECEGKAPVRLS